MPQNQEEIEAKLAAYIDGELDAAGRAEIEKHLEANPQHRTLIRDLTAQRDLVRSLPRATAPAEISETLQGQLERSVLLGGGLDAGEDAGMRISPWPHRGAIAAIILLTAGLSFFVYKVLPSNKPPELAVVPSREAMPAPATLSTEPQPLLPEQPLASVRDQFGVDKSLRDQSSAEKSLPEKVGADRQVDEKLKNNPQVDAAIAPAAAPSLAPSAVAAAPSPAPTAALTEPAPPTTAIASGNYNLHSGDVAGVAARPQPLAGGALALTPSAIGGGNGGSNANSNRELFAEKSASANQAAVPATTAAHQWCVVVTTDNPAATDAQVRAFLIANQIHFESLPASAAKDENGSIGASRLRAEGALSLARGIADDRRAARTEPAPTEPAPTEPAPTEPAPTEPAPTEPAPTEPAPTEPASTQPASLGLRWTAPATQPVANELTSTPAATAPTVPGGSIALAVPSTPTTAPAIVVNRAPSTLPTDVIVAEKIAAPSTQPITTSLATPPQASAEPTTQASNGQIATADQTMLYCSGITVAQANDLRSMLALRNGQSAELVITKAVYIPIEARNRPDGSVQSKDPTTQQVQQALDANNAFVQDQSQAAQLQAQASPPQSSPTTAPVDQKSDEKVDLIVIVRPGPALANPQPTTAPASAIPATNPAPETAPEPPAAEPALKNP